MPAQGIDIDNVTQSSGTVFARKGKGAPRSDGMIIAKSEATDGPSGYCYDVRQALRNCGLAPGIQSPCRDRTVGSQGQTEPVACSNTNNRREVSRNIALTMYVLAPSDHRPFSRQSQVVVVTAGNGNDVGEPYRYIRLSSGTSTASQD